MGQNITRVVVRCPECGAGRVSPHDVTVRTSTVDAGWTYRARCPKCGMVFVDALKAERALRVLSAGATLEYWDPPAETPPADDAPPFTDADLTSFLRQLDDPDWLGRLAG